MTASPVKSRTFPAGNVSLRFNAAPSRGNQFPPDTPLRSPRGVVLSVRRRDLQVSFPRPARRRFPAAAVFLFATFSFGGGFMRRPKRGPKPENSRTVNQWGMRGRVPIDPLKPEYVWDNYYGVPQSIYYLELSLIHI